jgi:hypothetical protein
LAIIKDASDPQGIFHQLYQYQNDIVKQEHLLGQWASTIFDLKASIDDFFLEGTTTNIVPCCKHLCQVSDFREDQFNLLQKCQMHKCSDYCLRKMKKKDVEQHNEMLRSPDKVCFCTTV